MKTYVMLIVSFFALAFGSDAFARGSHGGTSRYNRSDKVQVISEIEINGPFTIEVDYGVPLEDILLALSPHSTSVDDSLVAEYTRKSAGNGKVRKNIYLVRTKTDEVVNDLETRAKLKSGALVASSDENIRREMLKKSPHLNRAGPYELFTFAKVHGDPIKSGDTYKILGDQPWIDEVHLAEARKVQSSLGWFASDNDRRLANREIERASSPSYHLFEVRYRSGEPEVCVFRATSPITESNFDLLVYMD